MAWKIKEDEMKYAKYLCLFILLLSLLAHADENKRVPLKKNIQIDGSREHLRGCVLAIEGNKVNFEESWMPLAPDGVVISAPNSEENIDSFDDLRAPFYADIDIYWVGDKTYISAIRMLKQFEYSSDGYIIGEYHDEE